MAAARRRRFSLADYAAAHRQDTFQFNKSRRRNNLNLTLPEQAANEAAARRKSQAAVEAAAVGRNADVHQEAIEAFSVVAALVLGFSFSALVAVACELTNELRMGNAYVAVFCVMMAVSTALSGYSAVFFTMEVYYVKRLADEGGADQQLRLETFLTLVGYRRKLARNTTVIALALDMVAIGILIFGFLPLGVGIVVLVCLSCGSVLVVLIMVQMRQLTAYCLGLGSHEEDSITSTSTHLRGDQLPAWRRHGDGRASPLVGMQLARLSRPPQDVRRVRVVELRWYPARLPQHPQESHESPLVDRPRTACGDDGYRADRASLGQCASSGPRETGAHRQYRTHRPHT